MTLTFITVDSVYGKFIINRHDIYQFQPLRDTGIPHIQNEITKILEIVKNIDGAVIIDGGANIGLITISIAQNTNGIVYSFEPQRNMYYCLCGNVVINNLENVITYQIGLSDSRTSMYVPNIDYNASGDFGDVSLSTSGAYQVQLTSIDSMNLNKLDFLKLDIESMEILALRGAIHTITKFRPWCWIEYIKSDLTELVQFFKNLDYTVYMVDDANIVASPNGLVYDWMCNQL